MLTWRKKKNHCGGQRKRESYAAAERDFETKLIVSKCETEGFAC